MELYRFPFVVVVLKVVVQFSQGRQVQARWKARVHPYEGTSDSRCLDARVIHAPEYSIDSD